MTLMRRRKLIMNLKHLTFHVVEAILWSEGNVCDNLW